MHGYALLESTAHIDVERGPSRVLAPLLADFFIGEGGDRDRTLASVRKGLASI